MKPLFASIRSELAPHFVVFTACVCILGGVFLLAPPESSTGHIALGHLVLPDVCVFKNLTGLPCPGCGLTRSMSTAVNGDIGASFSYHRLGFVTVLYVFCQFLFSLMVMAAPRQKSRLQNLGRTLNKGLVVLGMLFFINWIVTLAHLL